MKVDLKADYEITDAACKEATGTSLSEWIAAIEARPGAQGKRRETVNLWLYPEMGKNIWWATTAWVEYERKNAILQKDGKLEGYNICVTKSIKAPMEKVYAAWVSDDVGAWFGDSSKLDADKSIEDALGNRATALRIRENKDLRYRWNSKAADGTVFDVTFTDNGGKTGLMLNHNRIQSREEADGLRRGWSEAFDRLKAMLE